MKGDGPNRCAYRLIIWKCDSFLISSPPTWFIALTLLTTKIHLKPKILASLRLLFQLYLTVVVTQTRNGNTRDSFPRTRLCSRFFLRNPPDFLLAFCTRYCRYSCDIPFYFGNRDYHRSRLSSATRLPAGDKHPADCLRSQPLQLIYLTAHYHDKVADRDIWDDIGCVLWRKVSLV